MGQVEERLENILKNIILSEQIRPHRVLYVYNFIWAKGDTEDAMTVGSPDTCSPPLLGIRRYLSQNSEARIGLSTFIIFGGDKSSYVTISQSQTLSNLGAGDG